VCVCVCDMAIRTTVCLSTVSQKRYHLVACCNVYIC